MATGIGPIEIQMLADLARLRQDMNSAKGIVTGATDSMGKAFGMLKGALGALGVGLSAGAIGAWVKDAINAADETSKLAQKMGVATKEVAGLQLAFDLSGSNAQEMQTSIARLSKEMANGNAAFERMGINVRDAQGNLRSTRDVLGEVADKFATYSDGAGKAALAQELFGKAGANLIPLLNAGADGLEEMDRMAEQLGLTIDENTAQSAERFNDTLSLIGQGTTGIGRQIAAQLLPTLEGLAGQFLTTMTEGNKLKNISDGISTALKALYVVGLTVVEVFKTIGTSIGGTVAAIQAAISGDFKGAIGIMRDLKTDIGSGWTTTLEQAKKAWNATGDAAVSSMVATKKAIEPAERATRDFTKATNDAAKATKDAKEATREFVPMLDAADSALTGVLSDSEMLAYVMSTEVAPAMDDTAAETARLASAAAQAGENLAAAAQQAAESVPEWQQAWEQIAQSMTDALMTGGKDVAKMLQDLFRTVVLRPVLAPVGAALTGAMGPGGAMAGTGGGGSLMSGIGSLLGGVGTFGSHAATGVMSTLTGAGLGTSLGAAGSLMRGGSIAGGLGMGLGAAAPYLAAAYMLYQNKDKILGGELKDVGISGSLGAGAFSGGRYKIESGGWFGNESTKLGDAGEIGEALGAGASAMNQQVRRYAEALGLPADAVDKVALQLKFSTQKLTPEQITEEISKHIEAYGQEMAYAYEDLLRPFLKANDEWLEALSRLAATEEFTSGLAEFGGIFEKIAGSSIGAKQALVDLMGGIEALGAATSSFVSNYYSESEQVGIAAAEVERALKEVGLDTGGLDSREDYRKLLESRNPETDSAQIAALLKNAGAFASISDYLAKTEDADSLATLAAGADAQLMQLQALTDSQAVGLETVSTSVVESGASIVAAINGLGGQLAAAQNAIAVYTQRTAQVLERVIPDGDALTVRAAT